MQFRRAGACLFNRQNGLFRGQTQGFWPRPLAPLVLHGREDVSGEWAELAVLEMGCRPVWGGGVVAWWRLGAPFRHSTSSTAAAVTVARSLACGRGLLKYTEIPPRHLGNAPTSACHISAILGGSVCGG